MKSSLHLVRPDLRVVADFPMFDPEVDDLAAYREGMIQTFAAMSPPGEFPREEHFIDGPSGASALRVLIYRPTSVSQGLPAILYFHGGGFVAGSPDMMAAASFELTQKSGAVVVAVDYRLAPETPFPGPLEDCYAALQWMHAQSDSLSIDPERISLMGDSAGGGLAAATALLARDRGDIAIRSEFLIYPMLDARTGTGQAPHDNAFTGEFIWSRAANRFGWTSMQGSADIEKERLAYFSPALSNDLSRLPPTFLAVGSLDLFLEEDVDYALRLTRCGVPVTLHLYEGGTHGFDLLPGSLQQKFGQDIADAFSRLL